jgi:hypothetical protein
MSRIRLIALALGAILMAPGAHAGQFAEGRWSPTGCGPQPEARSPDLSSPEAYNASLDAVNKYRQAINAYLGCLVQEANKDIQSVSQSANALQQAARATNDRILADVQAADKKFGK